MNEKPDVDKLNAMAAQMLAFMCLRADQDKTTLEENFNKVAEYLKPLGGEGYNTLSVMLALLEHSECVSTHIDVCALNGGLGGGLIKAKVEDVEIEVGSKEDVLAMITPSYSIVKVEK